MHFIFRISKNSSRASKVLLKYTVVGAPKMPLQLTLRKKDGKTGIVAENIPSSATARLR
jgi:hypothetical protein